MISDYSRKHGGKVARTSPFHADHRVSYGHRLARAFASSLEREPRPFRRSYDPDDMLEYLRARLPGARA